MFCILNSRSECIFNQLVKLFLIFFLSQQCFKVLHENFHQFPFDIIIERNLPQLVLKLVQ